MTPARGAAHSARMARRLPDYGLDAPGVVRLLVAATVAGAVLGFVLPRFLPSLEIATAGRGVRFGITGAFRMLTLVCGVEAAWMIWGSRVGKRRARERLLDRVALTGGERVLDVGCGRGLLMIGAARRLPHGSAIGIDLWSAHDLSANSAAAALANARAEGVEDRVQVHTADMRELPFADASFDAVVSSLAIHNVSGADGRRQALAEIARVLKPGGRLAIQDIGRTGAYARDLRALGFERVVHGAPTPLIFPPPRLVTALKPAAR